MAEWDLHINFDDGEITILDASTNQPAEDLQVEAGDTLKFKCEDHGWGIQFIGEGMPGNTDRRTPPLTPLSVNGESGHDGTITVSPDANPGDRWDYVAAVVHDNKVFTKDPDIRIKDRG